MKANEIEEEIVVHPVDGMQLSEGYIRQDEAKHVFGWLPGIGALSGDSINEVLLRLEQLAKAYYGDDVIIEVAPHGAAA